MKLEAEKECKKVGNKIRTPLHRCVENLSGRSSTIKLVHTCAGLVMRIEVTAP